MPRLRELLDGISISDFSREPRYGGKLKQVAERQFQIKGLVQFSDRPYREQRVPSQIEEVVMNTNLAKAQHLSPGFRHDLLDSSSWRNIIRFQLARFRRGFGKRPAIDFTAWRQRN